MAKSMQLPPISPDQPLQATDAVTQDKLQRGGFAASAVSALWRVSASAGFVLSIEGPWGAGKTSVLAMMEHLISKETDNNSIIVHFNPWLVGERDSLLRQFLTTVANAIQLKDKAAEAKRVSEELIRYADVFDFVKWVPGAEPWASILKGVLKSAGAATGGVADQKARDIEGQKSALESALSQLDKKIFVFIDDVDRLIPSEVFEMVRIIKAVGHLPNVGYVAAWDAEYITRSLRASGVPRAASYIDKIVQIRLPVPAISAHSRLQLINDGIESLPKEATAQYFPNQEERLQALYFHGLRDLLEQPRDITRVINTVSVIEPGLRGEVVFADLLGFATLMVRAPRVYDAIRKDTGPFTTGGSSYAPDTKKRQQRHKDSMEKIYARSPNPNAVRRLVHHLFPEAARASGNAVARSAIDVEGHLAAPSRLNIAMSMAIGVADVSLVDARRYIFDPAKRAEIGTKLTNENCIGFIELLGDVAKTVSRGELPGIQGLSLDIARLVDIPPLCNSENRRRFFTMPAETLAVTVIQQLVSSHELLKPEQVAAAIVVDPNALSVAAEILSDGLASPRQPRALVCSLAKQRVGATRLATNTIAALKEGRFWQCCNSARVLWTIMRGTPTSARKVFAEIQLEDPSLDKFALSFLKHSYSSSGGQSYLLPADAAVKNMVNKSRLIAHARRRLAAGVDYPVRAAWQSVVTGRPLYGSDGSDARM